MVCTDLGFVGSWVLFLDINRITFDTSSKASSGFSCMGLSLSFLSCAWIEAVRYKFYGLGEAEAFLSKSISFGEKDIKMTLRSLSFKRTNSGTKMVSESTEKMVLGKSLSFKLWEPSEKNMPQSAISVEGRKLVDSNIEFVHYKTAGNDATPELKPVDCLPPGFSSPRPLSELDAAALKLQKVYKSYRTRRNLADCAVVVEELWWKALDFASLEHSSVSFFNVEKQETAISRWARASTRVAKVGKGLSKDEKAQKLALRHWLEAIDPRHRYGHNLHLYYDVWFGSESTQPFFYWLDVGDGREINLDVCPRSKLQQQCIKYLGPKEREQYEVTVENGKLIYKHSEQPVDTVEGSKWIFVLSTLRTLYVGQKNKGTFQHSSFLAGGATTAAGRLVAKEGVLEAIWPYSGHYLPTEENFNEFISFLQDNNVDLTNVKRFSVDDDEAPSFKKSNDEAEIVVAKVMEAAAAVGEADLHGTETALPPKEPVKPEHDLQKGEAMTFELCRRLSCKWTTGTGPRIGCVRDYPTELQFKALEQVNLSPRVVPSPTGNKVPIPSPRPSPKMRLSPRLAYMGMPVPSPTGNKAPIPSPHLSPKLWLSPKHACMSSPTPTLTLPKHKRVI